MLNTLTLLNNHYESQCTIEINSFFGNKRRICYTYKSICFLCSSYTHTHTEITSFHYIITNSISNASTY